MLRRGPGSQASDSESRVRRARIRRRPGADIIIESFESSDYDSDSNTDGPSLSRRVVLSSTGPPAGRRNRQGHDSDRRRPTY